MKPYYELESYRYQNAIRRCAHMRKVIRELRAKIGKDVFYAEPGTLNGRIRQLEADLSRVRMDLSNSNERVKRLEKENSDLSGSFKAWQQIVAERDRQIEIYRATMPYPVPFWHLRRHYRIQVSRFRAWRKRRADARDYPHSDE